MKWVITENEDKSETSVLTLENWNKHRYNRVDTDGFPMKIVKEFEETDYEAARQVYRDHYGHRTSRNRK